LALGEGVEVDMEELVVDRPVTVVVVGEEVLLLEDFIMLMICLQL
jgi:hypothetical protein